MMEYRGAEIVVNNTKELESRYNLNGYPDNIRVRVLGGLAKAKYNKDNYFVRTTYPLGQLKQILGVMHEIESEVNPNWPELVRARFIYERLAENISYNRKREEYTNEQSSNLTPLLSREAICAGYSLIFKEMMDRQGIQCDYLRGMGGNPFEGKQEKHAWNVLTINGKHIPVDLTWDSGKIRRGEAIQYFGINTNFSISHSPDRDEINYQFSYMSPLEFERCNPKNYPKRDMKLEGSLESKKAILSNAILATYEKYSRLEGYDSARRRALVAVRKYIKYANPESFTREGFARQNLQNSLSSDDALDCIIADYVQRIAGPSEHRPVPKNMEQVSLNDAVIETLNAYNSKQARTAVRKFIVENKTESFTNQGRSKARTTLASKITKDATLDTLVTEMVDNIIERNRMVERTVAENTVRPNYFRKTEFELLESPDNDIIKKAMDWIKEKLRIKQKDKNDIQR